MHKEKDKSSVEAFARNNALYMNDMRYDDMDFHSPSMRDSISSWEGKYCYNGGVVAFVVSGNYYATPLVDEALDVLEKANFERGSVYCPFNAYSGFPGRLGDKSTLRMWQSSYYPNSKQIAAGEKMIRYYYTLMQEHNGYRKWNELLKRSGNRTMDSEVLMMIQDIQENLDDYNAYAARTIGVEIEQKRSRR